MENNQNPNFYSEKSKTCSKMTLKNQDRIISNNDNEAD